MHLDGALSDFQYASCSAAHDAQWKKKNGGGGGNVSENAEK